MTAPIVNLASNANTNVISKWYVWVPVLFVFAAILFAIKYFFIDGRSLSSFFDMFRNERRQGASGAMPPPIEPPQPPPSVHPDTTKDAWCFVGEDVTGRYCVHVPSAKSCESSRVYRSRSDCEMVPGHTLPAAIITKQGADSLPLLSAN